MTEVYFIRHAQPRYDEHDTVLRGLSEKGMEDRKQVTAYLAGQHIDAVFSSPYRRAYETVSHFAEKYGYEIQLVEDFRERKIDSVWIPDFTEFARKQWEDFDYKLSDGESLREVETRNIRALECLLAEYSGKRLVVGTHGTSLSTILHHYQENFGYEDFEAIRPVMPLIVRVQFHGTSFVSAEKIRLCLK